LNTLGWLLTWLHEFDRARVVTEESLTLFRAAGYRQGEADVLLSLGNLKQFHNQLDAGNKLFQQSLELALSLKDSWREANAYWFLGWDRRDFERSMAFWEKALILYRKVGDQIAMSNLLGIMGQYRVLNGDFELAEQYLDEAMVVWKSNTRANSWESPRITKSLLALARGDYEQAYAILEEALQSANETGNMMSYRWVHVRLGHAALRAGKLQEARSILVESARDFQKDSYTEGVVFALEGMAFLNITVGKHEIGARLIGWADATREEIKDPRLLLEQADVDQLIAACLTKLGEVAFSDLYDAGKMMTLDEAVKFGLWES
jgi:tetratricopeptide (TPR) repeat protein